MNPINFPQANHTFHKPADMTDEECIPLRVYDNGETFVSCWRLTWSDRLRILLGGPVWLWVWGRGHPPISVTTESPFWE